MADAERSATMVGATARRTATSAKSSGGTSRSTKSGARASAARAPRTKAASTRTAKAARARTSGAKAAKKPSTAKGSATTTVQRRSAAARAKGNGVNVPVPILTPHLKTVHVPTPGMSYVEDAGRVVVGYLPPPERLAFYGGLGIAAVAGLIDWPVAAAIGAGTMIARRTMRGARTRSGRS